MEPPREQVYQDHQCVAERLTFGERISAVLDPHRRFDVIESTGSDLVKNLRGVGHPILTKVDAARTPARHRAQAVVGVSDAQSSCEACEQGRRLDQHAPRQRLVERSPKETAAEREIGLTLAAAVICQHNFCVMARTLLMVENSFCIMCNFKELRVAKITHISTSALCA